MNLLKELSNLQNNLEKLEERNIELDKKIKTKYSIINKIYGDTKKALEQTNNKLNDFFYELYRENTESIEEAGRRYHSRIPEATGAMRLCQLGCIYLLGVFDRLLLKLNIDYNIDFGNLLGYVRTGRAIPWDDDVDIDIELKDIIMAVEQMKNFEEFKDFEIRGQSEGRIKFAAIGYTPRVDLIPAIKMNSMKEYEANKELLKKFRILRNKESLFVTYNNGSKDITSFLKALNAKFLDDFVHIDINELDENDEPILVRLAMTAAMSPVPTPIKYMYPTKRGVFEGVEVNIPNDPNTILSQYYGNYWSIPSNHTHRHPFSEKIDKILEYCDFIKNHDEEFYINRILPVLNEMEENKNGTV